MIFSINNEVDAVELIGKTRSTCFEGFISNKCSQSHTAKVHCFQHKLPKTNRPKIIKNQRKINRNSNQILKLKHFKEFHDLLLQYVLISMRWHQLLKY
ncbi:hypothetical protein O3M35_003581 [Rhynocoris fuscipes]|uniref:Uncharacterized protein n=1 Tax=Rhynocoris fuscipes TaxID=488301 RepID=A0AAW1CQF8_9HEMI